MAELTSEEKLLPAIFGEKTREVRDTSLRVPHGGEGIVHDIKIFQKENSDELPAGVSKMMRVYIAQKRKISVGAVSYTHLFYTIPYQLFHIFHITCAM